jgi:hypothetical protein
MGGLLISVTRSHQVLRSKRRENRRNNQQHETGREDKREQNLQG